MAVVLYLAAAHDRGSEGRAQAPAPPPATPQRALINQYCLGCHNDKAKIGGLSLNDFNPDAAGQHAEIAEKVIRKLRGGLMPPAGVRRPGWQGGGRVRVVPRDQDRRRRPRSGTAGRVPLRRLNRREYQYAVRDLLGLNIDATAWLPDDNVKGNFDNNAAALQVSPNFIDQYIYAARAVAVEAIGNLKAPAETITYGDVANMVISLPPDGADGGGRQQHHIEGMPFGTRGGFLIEHNFPADGEYELTIGDMALAREVPRMEFENTVIALLDGKEFYRTTIGGEADHKNDRPEARSGGGGDQRAAAQDPLQDHGRPAQAGHHLPAPQLRRKRRAHAHHRARGRAGAHPGGARAADPRAAVGDGHQPVAQPLEDLHLQAEAHRARSWRARTASSRAWRGAPSAARSPPRT